MNISFGDNVKILSTAVTDAKGLSGKTGQVYGETSPSVTSAEVIGELTSGLCAKLGNICFISV